MNQLARVEAGVLVSVGTAVFIRARVKDLSPDHSFRVRSTVSLAQTGAPVVDMQTVGMWKDAQMQAHYARAELAERGAMARYFFKK